MVTQLFSKQRSVMLLTAVLFAALLAGCAAVPISSPGPQPAGPTSSLVTYLYPNGERPPGLAQDIPDLKVPVRVGIAFVPDNNGTPTMSRNEKIALLQKVKQAFRHHRVIQQIRLIPPGELRSRGGFRELNDIAQRYNVDLVALVSHNQVRAISNNSLSITYVTIVGALVLPGNNHHVSTFIDTAVFDVESQKLLFHAAGKDRVSRQTSAFALTEKNAMISRRSIDKATGDMIGNLNSELRKFRGRLRQGSNEADVHYRRGYRGARIHKFKRRDRYANSQQQDDRAYGSDNSGRFESNEVESNRGESNNGPAAGEAVN